MKCDHYTILVGVRLATPLQVEGEPSCAAGFFQTVETASPSLGEAIGIAESAILKASEWEAFGDETGRIDRVEIDCAYPENSLDGAEAAPHVSGRVYYTDEVEEPAKKWWKLW